MGNLASFLERLIHMNAQLIADGLRGIAEQLDRAAPGPPAYASAGWVTEVEPGQEVTLEMGQIDLRDTDPAATGRVAFRDVHGHDTAPDDVPEWSSSDESVASVTASEDGMSCEVAPVGPGSAVVEVVSVDTDGTEVRATGLVNVTAGEASVGEVNFEPGVGGGEPAPEEPVA